MALPALVPPDLIIGNYRILSQLASGGMGIVYKAFDERLQRTVALKFLTGEANLPQAERMRVLREARAASILEHENVAAIHAVEETADGRAFIVMGYYDGENLAARQSRAPLSVEQSMNVIRQVLLGLAHAHGHNIIHRDIKPSNVILCNDGTAKIVDFGLARLESEDATQSIGVSGTLPYMSPEQVTGKQVDHRTDLWSVGVVMYELLTGRHPFQADSPATTVANISRSAPPQMREVPLPLQMMVYRALSKSVNDRYQSCYEFLREIEQWRSPELQRTASFADLKIRVRKAGSRSRLNAKNLVRWGLLLLVVANLVAMRSQILEMFSHGRANAKSVEARTTPTAYEFYERGNDSLQHFYRRDAINQALADFNQSVTADPKFALAYAAMAKAYFYQYRLDQTQEMAEQAEKNAKQALVLNDSLSDGHVILARLLTDEGKTALAESELHRALELDPKSSDVRLALADLYGVMGRAKDAERAYDEGIALNPETWDGYYRFGKFLIGQSRYQEAVGQFHKALALVPDHVYARIAMAVAMKELGRLQEAEAELKTALGTEKVYAGYANLANIYYEQGRFREAADAGSEALALKDTNYLVWVNQGVFYEQLGEAVKAEQAYEHALQLLLQQVVLKPDDAMVRADLALRLLQQKHDGEGALRHIRKALALQPQTGPKESRVLELASVVYYGVGDRSAAEANLVESMRYGKTLHDFELDPDMKPLLADKAIRDRIRRTQAQLDRKMSAPLR